MCFFKERKKNDYVHNTIFLELNTAQSESCLYRGLHSLEESSFLVDGFNYSYVCVNHHSNIYTITPSVDLVTGNSYKKLRLASAGCAS